MKLFGRLVFGLLVAVSVAGCFPIVAGSMAETAMVIADRRNSGTQAIDRGVQLEAESTIAKTYGDNVHVNVTVFNRKLLLTGEVRTDAMRAEIEAKVKAMKNVSEVINELNAAPLSSLSSRANDTFLTSKVKTSLIANENVPSNSMKIVTEAGKVYMLGIVTEAEANRAVDLARRASGVKQVVKLFDIISEADKKRLDAPPPK